MPAVTPALKLSVTGAGKRKFIRNYLMWKMFPANQRERKEIYLIFQAWKIPQAEVDAAIDELKAKGWLQEV